jgi:hypothetical protein
MTPTTPREALEKAYYEAIGPAFGPPEQLTEAYAARWEARRVRQAKSLTDTALTALAPWIEWETIDKAPRDDVPVDLWLPAVKKEAGRRACGYVWNKFYGKWAEANTGITLAWREPTHFMRTPKPPTVTP